MLRRACCVCLPCSLLSSLGFPLLQSHSLSLSHMDDRFAEMKEAGIVKMRKRAQSHSQGQSQGQSQVYIYGAQTQADAADRSRSAAGTTGTAAAAALAAATAATRWRLPSAASPTTGPTMRPWTTVSPSSAIHSSFPVPISAAAAASTATTTTHMPLQTKDHQGGAGNTTAQVSPPVVHSIAVPFFECECSPVLRLRDHLLIISPFFSIFLLFSLFWPVMFTFLHYRLCTRLGTFGRAMRRPDACTGAPPARAGRPLWPGLRRYYYPVDPSGLRPASVRCRAHLVDGRLRWFGCDAGLLQQRRVSHEQRRRCLPHHRRPHLTPAPASPHRSVSARTQGQSTAGPARQVSLCVGLRRPRSQRSRLDRKGT